MRIRNFNIAPISGADLLQVTVHSAQGVTGRSFCRGDLSQSVEGLASTVLPGRDPRAVSSIWDDLLRATGDLEPEMAARACAALDIACWDLKARINQEPLWRTLGGGHPGAVAYASLTRKALPDEDTGQKFRTSLTKGGFKQALVRLGADSEDDARAVARMQAVLTEQGFPIDLMLDFGGVNPDVAVRRITRLERSFDITWVKGVSVDGNPGDYAQVSGSIRAAVCAGGESTSEAAFLPLLSEPGVNVIEVDTQLLGITGTLRVSDAAFGYELPVTFKAAPGNLPIHLASALPNFMGMEVLAADDAGGPADCVEQYANGRAVAKTQPGNGIELLNGVTK